MFNLRILNSKIFQAVVHIPKIPEVTVKEESNSVVCAMKLYVYVIFIMIMSVLSGE